MSTYRIGSAILLIGALACASAPSSSGGQKVDAGPKPNADVILAAELADQKVGDSDALEAVRRLRPRFLATRGSGSINNKSAGSVHISVNGGSLQTVDNLSRLRVDEVLEIRYLSASDAAQRFGASASSGPVILVKTK